MTVESANTANLFWFDSTLRAMQAAPLIRRGLPRTRQDFGPARGTGLCLKRTGKTFAELDAATDFGLWLGEHGGRFIVAIKAADMSGLTGCECFASMEEVYRAWELD